jgi:hypothetical protein
MYINIWLYTNTHRIYFKMSRSTPVNINTQSPPIDEFSYSKKNSIQKEIEGMNKTNQLEILKILHDHNVVLNENKNGVRVNMTELQSSILVLLDKHIKYVTKREAQLSSDETERDIIRRDFLTT